MNDQINQYQQRLFYKLFATLPSVRKADGFSNDLNFDCVIDSFYYFKNKDFWFTRGKQKDKFLYLFGLKNKPVKDISGKDACLILDFDKNIQFNDNSLGLFSIKSSEIHILINYNILKERYPYINTSNFKITNFKSFDSSIDLEVIDLGNLDSFIENIEKLINAASMIKSQENNSGKIKEYSDACEICSKKKSNFKLDSNLNNLKKSKPELCGKCIEKIVASEFYTKLTPLLKGNNSDEIKFAKEKFGNDQQFEIGLKLLEKYKIIQYIGIKKLFYTLDKNSYLVNKYIKYSDKNNLLIDNIKLDKFDKSPEETSDDNFQENKIKKQIKIVKTDSFGNKNTIDQMNRILEDLSKGKSEEETIKNANISKNTYNYWINRGKQEFGDIYVQFYQHVNEIKSELDEPLAIDKEGKPDDNKESIVDNGIYEPLIAEYEELFNSMNQTGIAWVNQDGSAWVYSRNINGKIVDLTANTITELYKKVINNNLIWGIRDYELAKKFIDFPDDFEVPNMETEGSFDNIDDDFYASLSEEYEKSFSSMNKTGIAWVNQIGSKLYYMKSVKGKNIKIASENIRDLYEKVKKANQIWGIRDYELAKKFIDFPDDFEVPSKPQVRKHDVDVEIELDSGIYSPLPEEYEKSFTSMNNSGIAWVNQIGSKLYYVKSVNGRNIRLSGDNIYDLYEKVKKAKQIWGIRDYSRASQYIKIPKDFKIPKKQKKEIIQDTEIDESIYDPLPLDQLSKFNPNPNNKTGIAWVNKVGNTWHYQRQKNGKSVRISDPDIVKLHKKVIDNGQIWGIIDIDKAHKVIKTNSIDDEKPSKPVKQVKTSKVTVNYIGKSINKIEIFIKGIIKNKDLVDILVRLELFKGNINRIITTSPNKEEYEIFIELEINKKLLDLFEEKIKDLEWKINK